MTAPHLRPAPFEPPALSAGVVAALNAAAASGPARLAFGAGALAVSVRPAPRPGPGALRLDLAVGGEAAWLVVPPELLHAAGLPGAGAPAELAALLLEAALTEVLEPLEALLGTGIVLLSLRPWTGEVLVEAIGLHVALPAALGGQDYACVLHGGPFARATLAAAPPRRAVLDASQPILARVLAGLADVTQAELMSLRPGDAVVMEGCGPRDGRVLVVFGESWAAGGHAVDGAVRLDARPGLGGADFWRRWCMADGADDPAAAGHAPADAEVAQLRVTLVFEFGRRTASLAEVAALGPGSVLETGGGPDRSVDVLANGRRIGRGTVVLVGGAYAVQLHAIHVPGQPPAAAPVAFAAGEADAPERAAMPATDAA